MSWLSDLRDKLRLVLRRRENLYGMNRRNIELVYRRNRRRDYPLADDKLLAKEHLFAAGVPVPETLATCDGLFAIGPLLQRLADESHFVVKPANGSGGDGILVVGERVDGRGWRRAGGELVTFADLHRHLANIVYGAFSGEMEDRAFVEKRIVPHPVYTALWADGLCDVRVITVDRTPTVAMVRIPTQMSGGRANLHQGGIGLAVDLDTGVTTRAVHRRQPIERHPESDAPLLGIQLPAWPRLLEVARRTADSVPLGYLGVDLVVDAELGPLVLEINARPGLEIQNVHNHGLGELLPEEQA